MATQAPAQPTNAQAALEQQFLHNQTVLENTLWKWAIFGTSGGTSYPSFALNTAYEFELLHSSAYMDKIRIWLLDVPIEVTTTTESGSAINLNMAGLWAILGTLQVKLGQHVYQIRAGMIPLILSTFQKKGEPYNYPGINTYSYSSRLFGSVNGSTSSTSVQTASGTNTITGYLDIPMVLLEMVKDPDGIMPTLSNAGVVVNFTTVSSLTGTDALRYPFYSVAGATASVGTNSSGGTGTVVVMGHLATFKTVTSTASLPVFNAGVGYQIIENSQTIDTQTDFFSTFQGQSTNVKLVKSILIVNNPGEVAGQFGDPTNIQKLDLMYDEQNVAQESGFRNNPDGTFIRNFLVDQRQRFGDLPPNMFVFDWSAGTDAEYPNSYGYLDLSLFKNAGTMITRSNAWQSGAQVIYGNVYLNPTLYIATL